MEKSIIRFLKLWLVQVAAILIIITGCGKNSQHKTEIEFWTLQLTPEFTNYFNDLIKRYEKSHPFVSIKWVDIPYDGAVQKLMASIAAHNAPDVINLSSDFLTKFYNINSLMKLNSLLSPEEVNSYLPNAFSYGVFKKDTVALPWYLNPYALIYNKAMFKQAGFTDKDVPTTFDEMSTFARVFKNRTGKFAFFLNIGKDSFLPMILESEGVHMLSPDGKRAAFNTPEAVAIVDKWVSLFREGYLPRESITSSQTSIIEPYMSGMVASVFTGPVFLTRVQSNSPGIYNVTGVAPALTGKTGKSELAVMSIAIMASTKHPRESLDFALYVTNAQNQLAFSKIVLTFPSVREALKDSLFTIDDKSPIGHARYIGAKDVLTGIRLRTYFTHPDFDKLKDSFDEAIQSACLGKMGTEQALNKAAQEWDKVLSGNSQ